MEARATANVQSKIKKTQGARATENAHCGLQDKAGNVWFCTSGEGIYRYDGRAFVNFTVKDGLSSDTVWAIMEDRTGNIWFGTAKGICRYDGEDFSHVPIAVSDGLGSYPYYSLGNGTYEEEEVWSIVQDKTGKIWFGTTHGIYRYDGKSFTRFSHGDGVVNNSGVHINKVENILEDKAGNIWFGGRFTEGVFRFDGISLINIKAEGKNWLRPILEDKAGNIWLGTGNHSVYRYDGKTFEVFAEKELVGWVVSMVEDKAGNLWFATERGAVEYDGKRFTSFTTKDGLGSDWVYSITMERSGKLWIGTTGMGLSSYDGKTFTSFTE